MNSKEIETIIGIIEEAERNYILNKDEFLLKIKLEDMLKAKNNESLHLVSCSDINCKYEDRGNHLWCEKHGTAHKKRHCN